MSFVITFIIIIIIIILIGALFFIYNPIQPERYSGLDLLLNPGQIPGNIIPKTNFTNTANEVACKLCEISPVNDGCQYTPLPFVTPCSKSCEETFGDGWTTIDTTRKGCSWTGRGRNICKKPIRQS